MIIRDRRGREKIWRATTAHIWAHPDDGFDFFAGFPIAQLVDAEPANAVSLREPAQATGPLGPGTEPDRSAIALFTRNLWLGYPAGTWVVTLLPDSDIVKRFNTDGDHPAAEVLLLLAMDVDRNAFLPPGTAPETATTPLTIDGVASESWSWRSDGLIARVARTEEAWYAVIHRFDGANAPALTTRPR